MTMAPAPAASRSQAASRLSQKGDAPTTRGLRSSRPRYWVVSFMAPVGLGFDGGRRRRGGSCGSGGRRDRTRQLLVVRVVLTHIGLRLGGEFLGALGRDVLKDAKAGLVGHEPGEVALGHARVELEARLALRGQRGVVAEERPVAGLDGQLLLLEPEMERETVRNAVRVG